MDCYKIYCQIIRLCHIQIKKRTKIFDNKFSIEFGTEYSSLYKFCDLFLDANGQLNCQMDYSNGIVDGYQYNASYCFLIDLEGICYRMNVIRCARCTIDWLMKELKIEEQM